MADDPTLTPEQTEPEPDDFVVDGGEPAAPAEGDAPDEAVAADVPEADDLDDDAPEANESDESDSPEAEAEKKALPAELQQYLDEIAAMRGKPAKRVEKRFGQLVVKAEMSRQDAAAARAELERVKSELSRRQEAAPAETRNAPPAPQPGEPQLEDFDQASDPYTAWMDAKMQWRVQQAMGQQQQQQQFQQTQTQWTQAIEAFINDGHPDYYEKAAAAAAPKSEVVAQALLASGPALVYHLSVNPAIWNAINDAPPAEALMRLGAARDALTARPVQARSANGQAARTTKATKPIRPVGTAPVQTAQDVNEIDDLDSYVAEANRLEREGRL